ncbi:MAG TPA: histidinol-phosphate transaminase [Pirellulaceae bacterium]|nr:histidinol-phosphate transaminase [Pirellulaceae bacterium]
MMIFPRPEVLAVSEAEHGGVNHAEFIERGIDPDAVLDFSASTNPFGPSPQAIEALTKVPIDRYPDREATELRQALATQLDVSLDRVIAGNGSSELLYLIALAYLRPDDVVVIVGPTYSEYARAASLMGARLVRCDATAETHFEVPSKLVARSLRSLQPRAIFLCHPNNPTGQSVPASILRRWIDEFPRTLFIIDEAYIEFSPAVESLADHPRDNLIVLRSLTKAYGLAGLRLGYAVAHPEVIRVLCRVRPPWSVNAVAQAAGIAALNDTAHLRQSVAALQVEKERLVKALHLLGLSTCPSWPHFFLVRLSNAADARQTLIESRILVRECTSFGLRHFLRISPRCSRENAVLCEALRRVHEEEVKAGMRL